MVDYSRHMEIGGLVWYWCFQASKRKPGIVLKIEVDTVDHRTHVMIRTHSGYPMWFKSHSLMTNKSQIEDERQADPYHNAHFNKDDPRWALRPEARVL